MYIHLVSQQPNPTTITIFILQLKELRLGESEKFVSGYIAGREKPELESDSRLHSNALNL